MHETKIKHVCGVGMRNMGGAKKKYAIGVCFEEEDEI